MFMSQTVASVLASFFPVHVRNVLIILTTDYMDTSDDLHRVRFSPLDRFVVVIALGIHLLYKNTPIQIYRNFRLQKLKFFR